MPQINIICKLHSPNQAEIIYKSLQPEIRKSIPKTDIKLLLSENTLSLTITAKNTSTLRAASNSYIRWIQIALYVTESI
jgi:tRNA threonylcarbamoyladenosine modification (KEOPS) complex  Pcc1 subunit